MLLNKTISIASLDVDPETGKIWLNSPNLILRIQNIKFNHIEKKFSMIDINGSDAYMIPGDFGNNDYTEFLENLNMTVPSLLLDFNEKERLNILNSIFVDIKDRIQKIKEVKNDFR